MTETIKEFWNKLNKPILILVALITGGVGFIYSYEPAWTWLLKKIDTGFITLLTGVIGFAGLIFVAWWSGRQNSQAIYQSAMLQKQLSEDQLHIEKIAKITYFIEILHDLRLHVDEVSKMMDDVLEDGTEAEAKDCFSWIQKYILDTSVLIYPESINGFEFLHNTEQSIIEYSLRISSFTKAIQVGVSSAERHPLNQVPLVLDSCKGCITTIDMAIKQYEPLLTKITDNTAGKSTT